MKIEIILALVLISVFVIDYLLRKKKKPQSTEILIPDNSKTFKTKYFIRIGFISIIILACVYFYHFFPKKIVEDVNILISSEKYEEAFKKIDNFKTIYGKTINSDSLENKIHEIRISTYKNITYNLENLDSIRELEKYYDSYSAFNLSRGQIGEEISNKYQIIFFQMDIAAGLYDYHHLRQGTNFSKKKDSIKNIIQLKLKEARDFAFDEKNKKYLGSVLSIDAITSTITGDLSPLYNLLEHDSDKADIIELFLTTLRLPKVNYFTGPKNIDKKLYYDFARKIKRKINKKWYAERILIDEIMDDSNKMLSDDIFKHNIILIFESFEPKLFDKNIEKELKKLVTKYSDLDLGKYSPSDWINFYWTKSSIYLYSDKNVSLDALYTLENELFEDIENQDDIRKGVFARILDRIAGIKSEKNDVKGALEYYQRIKNLYDFKGKDLQLGRNISPDYSEIMYKLFMHKWNTKPYGDKDGACEDLKLAGKINASRYYDVYIKMCN